MEFSKMSLSMKARKQQPAINLSKHFSLPNARLSRKVILVVFASIVVVEGILLIPSVTRRKNEYLSQIEEVSAGQVKVLVRTTPEDASGQEFLERIQKIENHPVELIGKLEHRVVGGALYQASTGKLIGSFGEKPELSFSQVSQTQMINLHAGERYDAAWTPEDMMIDYILIFRHDISTVGQELNAFMIRIAGLVFIISLFVTLGVWFALDPLVITPILNLRKDLIKTGDAIRKDQDLPKLASVCHHRQDELGDVIDAFNSQLNKITTTMSERKQAQAKLQESLTQVQAYSQALDRELEKNKAYSQALDYELEKGREIQINFLPTELLQKPGWEISAFFQPARQVAGDFYDVFELPNGSLGLVIADVCDKGVGAALFMALFRSLIRIFSTQTKLRGRSSATLEANQPNKGWIGLSATTNLAHLNALQAIRLTNDYVADYHGEMGMFATVFFGILCPKTGLLTYINGGHEPLYILTSDGEIKESLSSTGPAVGMLPDLEFKIAQTCIASGEMLIGYTDGVPEARAMDGSFFTEERLLSLLHENTDSAKVMLQKIASNVLQHTGEAEQFDDITMLAIRHEP